MNGHKDTDTNIEMEVHNPDTDIKTSPNLNRPSVSCSQDSCEGSTLYPSTIDPKESNRRSTTDDIYPNVSETSKPKTATPKDISSAVSVTNFKTNGISKEQISVTDTEVDYSDTNDKMDYSGTQTSISQKSINLNQPSVSCSQDSCEGSTLNPSRIDPKEINQRSTTDDIYPNVSETSKPKTATPKDISSAVSVKNTKRFSKEKEEITDPILQRVKRWISKYASENEGLEQFCGDLSVIRDRKAFSDYMDILLTNVKVNGLSKWKITGLILLSPVGNRFNGWLLKVVKGLEGGYYLVLLQATKHCAVLLVKGEVYLFIDSNGEPCHYIPGVQVINNPTQFQHPDYNTCGLHAIYIALHLDEIEKVMSENLEEDKTENGNLEEGKIEKAKRKMRKVQKSYPSSSSKGGFYFWGKNKLKLRALQSNEEHVLEYITESMYMYWQNNYSGFDANPSLDPPDKQKLD